MENIFVEFLPPWVETGLQPAFYDKESGTVLQQTARMYDRVNMLIRMFNKLSKETKETVEEYIGKFNELAQYVDDYFDNLDVQEEINNKLDDMAEAGTLADIIAAYIQLKGILAYDTVADLKNATNIVDGSFVETYGFYSKGDGGGAKYKIRNITNDDTVDEILLIEITADPQNLLVAELILEDGMSIKQFGAKGDNEHDDTTSFTKAIASCSRLIINSGTYIINRFLPATHQEIIGSGDATIKVNGSVAPLCYIESNVKLSNLTIESTKSNLEWNRCDIYGKSNVTIENCTIKGFRHDNPAPNAWGILVTDSDNVIIRNCYFDNNSQSDIAVVQDTDSIIIENCNGTALHINFEPNNVNPIKNVNINSCDIDLLELQENSYSDTSIRNAVVSDCTINTLGYDGASVTFIDCKINNFKPMIANNIGFGGNLKLINSANLSKNLITDPYLDTLKSDGTEWLMNYTPSAWNDVVNAVENEDGRCIVLNENNTDTQISIKHSNFNVDAGDVYLFRINSKEVTVGSGSNYVSLNLKVKYLDSNNDTVSTVDYSINRHPTTNSDSGMGEISAILKVPTGASKMTIILLNSSYGTQSLYIRSAELYKFKSSDYCVNNIESLPIRNVRTFKNNAKPSGNCIPYQVGDRLYYNDPSTYLGSVCTVAGRPGTWRDF